MTLCLIVQLHNVILDFLNVGHSPKHYDSSTLLPCVFRRTAILPCVFIMYYRNTAVILNFFFFLPALKHSQVSQFFKLQAELKAFLLKMHVRIFP